MSEEKLKEVNIYSFNDENYVSLQDYAKLQQRIDKSLSLLKAFGGGKIIIIDVIDIYKVRK